MQDLIKADRELFHLLNGKWHTAFLDTVMPVLRSSQTWVPLYLFLFVFVLFNFKKNIWWWAILAGCTAILADFVSSDIIKENFYRIRPCNDPTLRSTARFLLSYRPQSSSFTSSHAVNHFALATYLYFTLKDYISNKALLFFLWALIIIYAQVYVGVHFPLDVVCGALIGIILGYLPARVFNKQYSLA